MSQYPAQPYGVQVQQVPQPGYNPGERRSLNIYFNYDVVSGGKEEKTLVEPDDREWFQRWTVQ